ncbi:MAG: ABC transporter ATP-binding protein [Candidatus Omnitrophota bacterium]
MILEAKDIHKVYNDGSKVVPVLRGVTLSVKKGGFVAVTGPSGAGKSTLLHILGGLDSPTSGSIAFEGKDLARISDSRLCRIRNKQIGFVFQFYHLLPEFTVLENVLMPALISQQHASAGRQLKKEALGLLEGVGLSERIAHFPSQLSGGEKQRVAIARALINKPELLFCDEPTGNLDSESGSGIAALIKKVNLENKTAVVLVTHNLELAKSAERVYHLKDGVLVN